MTNITTTPSREVTPAPDRLAECEAIIERGLRTFIEVGEALREIRDAKLYAATHATFEDYCKERWGREGISRARAYQLIAAAEVSKKLDKFGLPLPATDAVARELHTCGGAKGAIVIWNAAISEHGPRPTAAQVREIREQLINGFRLRRDGFDGPTYRRLLSEWPAEDVRAAVEGLLGDVEFTPTVGAIVAVLKQQQRHSWSERVNDAALERIRAKYGDEAAEHALTVSKEAT
jgi:hypothetical protein